MPAPAKVKSVVGTPFVIREENGARNARALAMNWSTAKFGGDFEPQIFARRQSVAIKDSKHHIVARGIVLAIDSDLTTSQDCRLPYRSDDKVCLQAVG